MCSQNGRRCDIQGITILVVIYVAALVQIIMGSIIVDNRNNDNHSKEIQKIHELSHLKNLTEVTETYESQIRDILIFDRTVCNTSECYKAQGIKLEQIHCNLLDKIEKTQERIDDLEPEDTSTGWVLILMGILYFLTPIIFIVL